MKESYIKNKKGIILMICSAVLVCIGQLLWKESSNKGFLFITLGFGFYGIGALFMIIAYRFGSLSVLQPMLSLNYVLSIILASLVLREEITFIKIVGVIIIILGVFFIGGGDSQ